MRTSLHRAAPGLQALGGLLLFTSLAGCSGDAADTARIERELPARDTSAEASAKALSGDALSVAWKLAAFSAPGWYGFATRDFTFIDETRSTPWNDPSPVSPVRTLPTRVFYPALPHGRTGSPPPAVPVPVASGTFPIVAYAHPLGSRGEPARFMCEHLATHGYICVVPQFPLTHGDAPGGPTLADVPAQPGDLDFVMRAVAMLGGPDADLGAAVDSGRRGVLGLSVGGLTALLAAYHPALGIDDLHAAVAQAPLSCFLGAPVFSRSLPTLLLTGTADLGITPEGPERVFQQAPPPIVHVELLGGTHAGFLNIERPFVDNTDIVECQLLIEQGELPGALELAAGIAAGAAPGAFDPSVCAVPCVAEPPQTMGATRQQKLARAATLAHFEAVLRNSSTAAAFLTQDLDTLSDVQVGTKP